MEGASFFQHRRGCYACNNPPGGERRNLPAEKTNREKREHLPRRRREHPGGDARGGLTSKITTEGVFQTRKNKNYFSTEPGGRELQSNWGKFTSEISASAGEERGRRSRPNRSTSITQREKNAKNVMGNQLKQARSLPTVRRGWNMPLCCSTAGTQGNRKTGKRQFGEALNSIRDGRTVLLQRRKDSLQRESLKKEKGMQHRAISGGGDMN